MLCGWGTFTGREPPVHRTKNPCCLGFPFFVSTFFFYQSIFFEKTQVWAVQHLKWEPAKAAAQTLYKGLSLGHAFMACNAMLVATDAFVPN